MSNRVVNVSIPAHQHLVALQRRISRVVGHAVSLGTVAEIAIGHLDEDTSGPVLAEGGAALAEPFERVVAMLADIGEARGVERLSRERIVAALAAKGEV